MTANEKSEFETMKRTVRELKASQMDQSKSLSSIESVLEGLAEAVKGLEAASKEYLRSTNEPIRIDRDKSVALQLKRCSLFRTMLEEEDNDEQLSRELRNYPTLFENKGAQYILDSFDYDYVVEAAAKLGFTFGTDEKPICKAQLIKDAIEGFTELSEVKSGRIQRGRLVVNKFWSEEEGSWYTMDYFIEHQEEDYDD